MTEPTHRSSLGTAIVCKDAKAEIEWLQKALGFELTLLLTDDDGNVGHSEMSFGTATSWSATNGPTSPRRPAASAVPTPRRSISSSPRTSMRTAGGRARAAPASSMEPEDQFYGDRTYRARDPEGHVWTFSQTVREVPESEWEAASGLKVAHSL